MNNLNKQFFLLWLGQLISGIGSGLTSFALAVYIFEKTGRASDMALITLLAFVPTLLLSVPAGILADRYDRRLLMMIGDGCSALGIAYILFVMHSENVNLLQICIGVTLASSFSALLEPAYKATLSDLLSEEAYSKASGLVSLASSSRYLIAPILAGCLLAICNVQVLLLLDIVTFLVTVICTGKVRRTIKNQTTDDQTTLLASLRLGWKSIAKNKGIMILIGVSSLITYFMGIIQVLAEPLILSFSSSQILGLIETICASGMLVSGLYLGIFGIKKHFIITLSSALGIAGLAMVLFGYQEHLFLISCAGFLFFAMLPLANNCLDYIIRIHLPTGQQGRAWGLIGLISQLGYVGAFCTAGILADTLGIYLNIGVGRGSAYTIRIAGVGLVGIAFTLSRIQSVRRLENEKGQSK